MRFFSRGEPRRKSRRFTPGGLPATIGVEHLERRIVLDAAQDAANLIELITGDLNQTVGSGEEAVNDFPGWNISGDQQDFIHSDIELSRTNLNQKLDAKTTAWNNYKTIMQSDLIRIDTFATSQSWPSDWKTMANPTTLQSTFRNLIGQINTKITQCDTQLSRISGLKVWDNMVFDELHTYVELHESPMGNGGVMQWTTCVSFATAEQNLIDELSG